MKNYWIILVLLGTFFSCREEKKFAPSEAFILKEPVLCELSRLEVLDPENIVYVDSLLVLNEAAEKNFLKILSPDNRVVFEYGSVGKGPEEFLEPATVQPFKKENSLFVGIYDDGNSSYRILKIRDLSQGIVEQERVFESDRFFDNIIKMKDCYVLSPIADSSFLCLYDGEKITGGYAEFPVRRENIPLLTHSMACTGILKAAPGEDRFAVSVFYDGGIRVFAIEQGQIKPLWEFRLFDMNYDVGTYNAPLPNEESRYGYMSICFSPRYLYALYSGKYVESEENAGTGTEIHVFDLNGNPVRKYTADYPLTSIAVYQDEELSALGLVDGEPYLLRYRLPE